MRDHLGADLWLGSFDSQNWSYEVKDKDDFTRQLWNGRGRVVYLHEESKKPIWKYIKRQLFFMFSPKIRELAKNYDLVIFSFGNIAFVPQRIKQINPKIKSMAYVHTPPRAFADQFSGNLQKMNPIKKPFAVFFKNWVASELKKSVTSIDYVITNSTNIRNRLFKFIGYQSNEVIFPAVDTASFGFEGQEDFYHSHARLEPMKRIKMIVEAFARMPDKKLIITSSGPLKDWVEEQIKTRNLHNIKYEGRVSDERRNWLMNNCIAGIYIPVDEDAGITQCEFMAAGKPVIGVKEGGLLETVSNGVTGILIPANPNIEDLIDAVKKMTPELALSMKARCQHQASLFDKSVFFAKLDRAVGQFVGIQKLGGGATSHNQELKLQTSAEELAQAI